MRPASDARRPVELRSDSYASGGRAQSYTASDIGTNDATFGHQLLGEHLEIPAVSDQARQADNGRGIGTSGAIGIKHAGVVIVSYQAHRDFSN